MKLRTSADYHLFRWHGRTTLHVLGQFAGPPPVRAIPFCAARSSGNFKFASSMDREELAGLEPCGRCKRAIEGIHRRLEEFTDMYVFGAEEVGL